MIDFIVVLPFLLYPRLQVQFANTPENVDAAKREIIHQFQRGYPLSTAEGSPAWSEDHPSMSHISLSD
jgi:hypothetical protein